MSPLPACSPRELRRRANKYFSKGKLSRSRQALLEASEVYRKQGKLEPARRLKFEHVVVSALEELGNALVSGTFSSVTKESRKLKRISGLNEDQKRFAEYLDSLISIWKILVDGKAQVAIKTLERLEQSVKKLPIIDADLAAFFKSFLVWAQWDVKQVQALEAYGRGDLVEYEKRVGETRQVADSIKANNRDDWTNNFVTAYARQNEGLLPLSDGIKAAFALDLEKAQLSLRKASKKFGEASLRFSRSQKTVPRAELYRISNEGYRKVADTVLAMTKGDSQLFSGQAPSARNYYTKAIKTADTGIPLLSKVGFLGANMLSYLVQQREIAAKRKDTIRVQKLSSADTRRGFMKMKPIFGGNNFPAMEDLCFVLAPFDKSFTRIFKQDIRPALQRGGFRALRADNIFSSQKAIIEGIWGHINKSRLIVADVTGKNPNVFYELGIAHTVGKDVVIITQRKDDIPFDLRHLRYFTYSDSKEGRQMLRKNLESTAKLISRP